MNSEMNLYKLRLRDIMNKERNFLDAAMNIGIVLGALLILVWALLKAMGIIHSPAWVEMLPYFGGGISVLGGAYKLGKIKKGIEDTEGKVDRILKIEERFNILENEHKLAMEGKLRLKH